MSQKSKKTAQKPLTKNPEPRQVSLETMALILTILDKEAHNSLYFVQMLPENVDESYIAAVRHAQDILIEGIPEDLVDGLLDKNPHLAHLFGIGDYLEDYKHGLLKENDISDIRNAFKGIKKEG